MLHNKGLVLVEEKKYWLALLYSLHQTVGIHPPTLHVIKPIVKL